MNFIINLVNDLKNKGHKKIFGALEILKYIGPGFLVTVGFIDPGNWASNIAAGSYFGYSLIWVVTLSTVMLIILQHNVAHLGIVTGLCLSESINKYFSPILARFILFTAMIASVSTSLAEIMGGAIALNILFKIPIKIGSIIISVAAFYLLFSNRYRKIEKIIIAFVSIIGISFIYELALVDIDWHLVLKGAFIPNTPFESSLIIISVLGAVVMPHNLFLHSEIIQSRQWNLEKKEVIEKQLKYEFMDTFFSMLIGWAINSAMIILSASVFFTNSIKVERLEQASSILTPILGSSSALIFSVALLFSGFSSTITSAMAGASIFAGMFNEPMNLKDIHSKSGAIISLLSAVIVIIFVSDPFKSLIYSQAILGMLLPFTIFSQIKLTSSKKVMGEYKNSKLTTFLLLLIGFIVTWLNIKMIFKF